jgi:glucose/arabinose dehydrogenase
MAGDDHRDDHPEGDPSGAPPTRDGASPAAPTTSGGRGLRIALAGAVAVAAAVLGLRLWSDGDTASEDPRPTRSVDPGPVTVDDGEPAPPPDGVEELPAGGLALEPVATVGFPTSLVARPGTGQLYVTDKVGVVRRLVPTEGAEPTGDGPTTWELVDEPVLDVSDEVDPEGERGLLGLAFSPDGDELALYRTALDGTLTIEVVAMDGDGADPTSRRTVLEVDHPRTNHNGGQLVTGPDGLLYAGLGDGGGAGDPDDNGQDPTTLLGTIVRIDPWDATTGQPYAIPDGNPFAAGTDAQGRAGAPEVWAWGLRNPWRFSFDRATDDLWIGDVGQNAWEEIDLLPAQAGGAGRGANLGWSELEGTHPFDGGQAPAGAVPPLFEYGRESGECSVTGGYVYRGSAIPSLAGTYVYADLCRPELRGLVRQADGQVVDGPIGLSVAGGNVVSFGEDADGELYVLTADGAIARLVGA